MATQPLETIREETSAPAQQATTLARVTADPPKQSQQRKRILAAWLLANALPNATAWPVKKRKRRRPQNLHSPVASPRLSRGTPAQNHPATRFWLLWGLAACLFLPRVCTTSARPLWKDSSPHHQHHQPRRHQPPRPNHRHPRRPHLAFR